MQNLPSLPSPWQLQHAIAVVLERGFSVHMIQGIKNLSLRFLQGSNGAQDAENSRIAAIADEFERLCAIHEAQLRDSQADVSHFEAEQRAAKNT